MLMYFAHVCGGREVSSISSYSSMLVSLGCIMFTGSISLLTSKNGQSIVNILYFYVFLQNIYNIGLKDLKKEDKSYFWEVTSYLTWITYIPVLLICSMTEITGEGSLKASTGGKKMSKAAGGTCFKTLGQNFSKNFSFSRVLF